MTTPITTPSTAHHPYFQQRLNELRDLYPREYGEAPEVELAQELYQDLETSRVIAQSVLGTASSTDVLNIFMAMQQWAHLYHQ